jgi:carboxyl-terminal processing protease
LKIRRTAILLLCILLISNAITFLATSFFHLRTLHSIYLDKETRLLLEAQHLIKEGYFGPVDSQELTRGAIQGMLNSIDDPYTSYLSPEQVEQSLALQKGSFGGIGVKIQEHDQGALILRIFGETPAERKGLRYGDVIVEVDGDLVAGENLTRIASLLRGSVGTSVDISIKRPKEDALLNFVLVREDIEIPTVRHKLLNNEIGYVEISSLSSQTADDLRAALRELDKEEIKGLIIDLRNNPGGLLRAAIDAAEILSSEGKVLQIADYEGNIIDEHHSSALPLDYPAVVLVNEHTASGAEIVAGAMKSSGAPVIGVPTRGKARIQQLRVLSDGSGIRYTTSMYLIPPEKDLEGKGIQPNYYIETPEEYLFRFLSIPFAQTFLDLLLGSKELYYKINLLA